MRPAVVVLLLFAVTDLAGCGLLLAVVWAEHRRQRRLAKEAGQPVPRPATGQFAVLGAVVLLGLVPLYAAVAFLLDE